MSDSLELLRTIEKISSDTKSIEPVSFDMAGFSSEYKYTHICGATSGAHIRGICENIRFELKKNGVLPLGAEGEKDGSWALLDYNDVIIHVFDTEVRKKNDLEEYYQSMGCHRLNA